MSILMSHEEVYFTAADDQHVQERRRLDTILAIIADHIRHEETSEIRDYVLQTLRDHDTRPYASVTDANAMGQWIASVVADAMDEQVAMREAVGGR